MVKYDKDAVAARTGTGDNVPRSAQTPGSSSRPKSNRKKSGAKVHSDSSPRQVITGCHKPHITNENAFNDNYYHHPVINNDNRKSASKGRRSKKRQQESSSGESSSEESSDSDY